LGVRAAARSTAWASFNKVLPDAAQSEMIGAYLVDFDVTAHSSPACRHNSYEICGCSSSLA
jgi:hypothetical protein